MSSNPSVKKGEIVVTVGSSNFRFNIAEYYFHVGQHALYINRRDRPSDVVAAFANWDYVIEK